MKSTSAFLLQTVILLLGAGVLGLLLWEPHVEGRNAHATVFEIYCKDPFLAYVYVGSIPFFVALQRAFRLLGDVRRRGTFSDATLHSLRAIKRCGLAILGFVGGAVILILRFGDPEDRPAGFFMALLVAFGAGAVVAVASFASRLLASRLAGNHRASNTSSA